MINQLRQMAIFAKTIDHGSFRAAAKALKLSPSVVSHQIADLEARLGVALLYRSTRSISLTRDGERLLKSANDMLNAAEDGLRSITETLKEPSGEINITMPSVMAHSKIIHQLSRFTSDHPNIELSIDFTDTKKNIIKDGYDLSIRMGWLKDSALISRKISDVDRRLVASRTYVSKREQPETPSDLADWDWLQLSPVRNIKPKFFHKEHKTKTINPNCQISLNDAYALYQFSRNGSGLAIVPEFLAKTDIENGIMEHVLPSWHLESLGIYAVWPQNAPKGSLTRYLVDYLGPLKAS
jgi:DNA-binding transcriptional LysR family regulator